LSWRGDEEGQHRAAERGQQVERQIADPAKGRLQGRPEAEQRDHVRADVQEPGVQERRRQEPVDLALRHPDRRSGDRVQRRGDVAETQIQPGHGVADEKDQHHQTHQPEGDP